MKLPCQIKVKNPGKNKYRVVIDGWKIPPEHRKTVKELMGESASFSGRGAAAQAQRFADKLRVELKLYYLSQGDPEQTVRKVLIDYCEGRGNFYRKQLKSWLKCGVLLDRPITAINFDIFIEQSFQVLVRQNPRKREHMAKEIETLRAATNRYRKKHNKDFHHPDWEDLLADYGTSKTHKIAADDIRKAFTPEQLHLVVDAMSRPKLSKHGIPHHAFEPIYHYAFGFMAIYGFRIGEVMGMEWDDLDLKRGSLSLTGHIEWYDENGRVVRNKKVPYIKQFGEIDPNNSPIVKELTNEARKLLLAVWNLQQSRGVTSRFIFANAAGDVPQYSAINKKYERTLDGLIKLDLLPKHAKQAYNMTHKIRKTSNTIGAILSGAEDRDKIRREHLNHGSEGVNKKNYVDKLIDGYSTPIPDVMGKVIKGEFNENFRSA